MMNLYLIQRKTSYFIDDDVAAVIRAKSSVEARKVADRELNSYSHYPACDWTNPRHAKLRKIGEVSPGANRKPGVVLRQTRGG